MDIILLTFVFSFTVKPAAATWCHLVSPPPVLGRPYSWEWIGFFYKSPSMDVHLRTPATSHFFVLKSSQITCLCTKWPPYWKCHGVQSRCYSHADWLKILAILLLLASNEPISAIVTMGCLLVYRNIYFLAA